MTSAARRCERCGADAPRSQARFCEHCGAPLDPAPVEAPRDPFGDVERRFQELAAQPGLDELLRATPEVPELGGKLLPSLLWLALLGALGFLASLVCLQICPPLGFAPLVLVLVGVIVIVRQLLWNARAPLRAAPVLVVERRARLQAGAERSPSHTRHFVTLRHLDGSQEERECFASALAGLDPGAMGVAYVKGERLASFARLPV